MRILGIDPGTATTGFGIIETSKNAFKVCEFGLIETAKDGKPGERLININKQLSKLIKRVNPDVLAVERLFFATNAKTAMAVGQAIGIILFTAAKEKVEIFEYAPGTIKKQIAGNGRADKKMMQKAVRKVLGTKVRSRIHGKTHFDNSADALAVALCHAYNINGIKKEGD
jgi:crossover junction endodeoxyribonuclease RuvC